MNDKKENPVIGYLAGFLIAAALGGGYILLVGPIGPSRPTGDDDPIVVAGGSLEIGSRYGFDPGGDKQHANHSEPNRYLNRVEVLYNDKGGPAYAQIVPNSGQPVTIAIAYCPAPHTGDKCADLTKPDDTITFSADSGHQNLGVSNGDKSKPIGDIPAKSKKLMHGHADWKVNQITVNGQDYLCDNGKCQVVLHYCNMSGGCK